MNILGISAYYHDSAACLVRDGKVIAAAQEERFTRVKNTGDFPIHAINFCIQRAGIGFHQIDHVAYFEKPYLKFSRVLLEHLSNFPFSWRSFLHSIPEWLENRLSFPLTLKEETGFGGRPFFLKHHLSHAAAAYYPSGFEESAILTVDGVGEWGTLSTGHGRDTKIRIEKEILYPDSLGLLYTTFTVYLGFAAHGHEGKTMAMAGFGEPRFLKEMGELIQVLEDGSFRINQRYFSYRRGSRMWNSRFEALFGPPRVRDAPLEQRHYDIAASLQAVLEDVLLRIARALHRETGSPRLCLAGGVALNCVANAKILEYSGFREIFVQPAAGDSGGAIGAALYAHHGLLGAKGREELRHAYLGPEYNERDILKAIKASDWSAFRKLEEEELIEAVAEHIAANRVVGWFQERMEFGPRALGSRSILGNPCHPAMGTLINEKVKNREPFQPFAPMVLAERASEYFELSVPSPFMLLAPRVREQWKEKLCSVTHVDGTARVQTVGREEHPRLRKLIERFGARSGVPVLLNTSFNRRGEPIVCEPAHAIECFLDSGMDVLAIGNFLLEKT